MSAVKLASNRHFKDDTVVDKIKTRDYSLSITSRHLYQFAYKSFDDSNEPTNHALAHFITQFNR